MPYFIYKVWRESGRLELLRRVETPPLSEANSYRRAEAMVREARRAATPADGYYVIWLLLKTKGRRGQSCGRSLRYKRVFLKWHNVTFSIYA